MTDVVKGASLVKRLAAGAATLIGTGLVIAIAGISVWQGSSEIANRAQAVEKPQATEQLAVSVARIEMQEGYSVLRRFTGQIEALQTVSLSFEQSGTVDKIFVEDGDAVAKGDVIARLDDRLMKAELTRLEASKKALEAQLELATLTDERQAKLKERGFASAQVADQTRLSIIELSARMAEVEATISAAEIRLEKMQIRSPFDGTVNTRLVDAGNTVSPSQGVVSLVEAGAPIFRVGIAPDLVDQLKLESTIDVTISSKTHKATIIAILPQIDPVTRTRIVRAQFNEAAGLAFGITGEATVREDVAAKGAWVPLTALEDGIRGLWTIKIVPLDTPSTVGLEAVEVVYADSDRAFVRGTFAPNARYIDTGVHRVVSGQQVRVQN